MAKKSAKVEDGVKKKDLFDIPVDLIEIQQGFNARRDIKGSDEEWESFKGSIEENGIQVPLIVKKEKSKYKLVAGERRLTAARELGFKRVPCITRQMDPKKQVLVMLIENDGKPLTAAEEAEAICRLERFGWTEAEIARKIGKSLSHVKNRVALGNSDTLMTALQEGTISVVEANELARIDEPDEQEEALDVLVAEKKKSPKGKISPAKRKEIIKEKKTPKRKASQKRVSRNAQDIEIMIDHAMWEFNHLDADDEFVMEEEAFLQGVQQTLQWLLGGSQPEFRKPASFDMAESA